jgi:Universal stress protein UspA and related nucleotide-binding proteins
MSDQPPAQPKVILLATDLGCQSDRALDRAVALAGEWNARLIAATIVEPDAAQMLEPKGRRRITTPLERARRTLESHLAASGGSAEILVTTGDPAAELQSIAMKESCDLVVVGGGRNDMLGGLLLGGTAKRLIRTLTVPLLVVHDRPAGPYGNIVVATDRSPGAREALLASASFFPRARLTLFHAHDVPSAAAPAHSETDYDLRSHMLAEVLADPRVSDDLATRLDLVVETGAVERLISEFAEDHFADLTVVGSHGHGILFEAIIGSTERKLLETHSGDLLIVGSADK